MGIYCANQEVIHYFMYKSTDYFLNKLQTEQGRDRYDHPIVWCDNSPAQFKQNFIFVVWITWSQEETSYEQT